MELLDPRESHNLFNLFNFNAKIAAEEAYPFSVKKHASDIQSKPNLLTSKMIL
jgi:hypothetical protein